MKRSALVFFAVMACVSGLQALDAYPYTQVMEVGAATW